jgi:hypothetical protein
MRKQFAVLWLVLLSDGAQSQPPPSAHGLVDVAIGAKLPDKYVGQGQNMGAFTFITVPVAHDGLRVELQDVNLFSDSQSGLVAGFRGDRAMLSQTACMAAARRVDSILGVEYPVPYRGTDPRYKHQSKTGEVVAGVRCSAGAVATLTLEVTNPVLEDSLMQREHSGS